MAEEVEGAEAPVEGAKAPTTTPAPTGDAPPPAWYGDTITDEKHQALASRYTSAADVVSALAETQRTLSSRPKALAANATEEEVTAYRTEQGLPTSADGYEVIRPDNMAEEDFKSEGFQKSLAPYRDIMMKHNLPTSVLQELFDVRMTQDAAIIEAQNTRDYTNAADGETAMRKEWGPDYDANISNAGAFLKVLGADELLTRELKGGNLLGSDPAFMRIAAMAGARLGIGTAQLGLAGTEAGQNIQEEYDRTSEALHLAHGQGNTGEAKRLDALRTKLGEQLHGTSIVGAGASS